MEFKIGDSVVHYRYGLGTVAGVEERTYNNSTTTYYEIQIGDLTIWVPADENLENRLRLPASAVEFKETLSILSAPAENLPRDRRERNTLLQERIKDGTVNSLCGVIRDLTSFRGDRSWGDYDNALMKRAQKALIGEWVFVLSVTSEQAAMTLQRLLASKVD